jgi:hypothetical protein
MIILLNNAHACHDPQKSTQTTFASDIYMIASKPLLNYQE